MVEEDGVEGRREIAMQIGHPYWVKDGIGAACPVALHGFSENMQAMRGIDFVQTLDLAIGFLDMLCRSSDRVRFFWPDGKPYEPLSLGKDQAERILVEQDGVPGRRAAFLQIGYPQWMKGGDEAACTVAIKGLDETMPPVRGRDFFEVLARAARALKARCKTPPAGVRLFYDDSNEAYTGEPFDRDELEDGLRKLAALYPEEWPVLVERKILMHVSGSEKRTEITLRIGHPYWEVEGEAAACPIAMTGLDDGPPVVHGDDPFMALANALKYMSEYFAGVQCGRWFFWPNGDPYAGDFPDLPPPQRFERDPRGEPGNWDVLAERVLWTERDGEPGRRRLGIRIGRPYVNDESQAYCPFTIKGWSGESPGPIAGSTPYSAFVSALGFFETFLMPAGQDTRYFRPDGMPYQGEIFDRAPEST